MRRRLLATALTLAITASTATAVAATDETPEDRSVQYYRALTGYDGDVSYDVTPQRWTSDDTVTSAAAGHVDQNIHKGAVVCCWYGIWYMPVTISSSLYFHAPWSVRLGTWDTHWYVYGNIDAQPVAAKYRGQEFRTTGWGELDGYKYNGIDWGPRYTSLTFLGLDLVHSTIQGNFQMTWYGYPIGGQTDHFAWQVEMLHTGSGSVSAASDIKNHHSIP